MRLKKLTIVQNKEYFLPRHKSIEDAKSIFVVNDFLLYMLYFAYSKSC